MIGNLVGILSDRGRHDREYRSTNIPAGLELRRDLWGDVRAEFESRGFEMQHAGGQVIFTKPGSKSWGKFDDGECGVEAAWEALSGGVA